MTDRVTFFQSVDHGKFNYEHVITSLFDQFSAMYNMLSDCNQNTTIKNITDRSGVKFSVNSVLGNIDNIYNSINSKYATNGYIIETYGRVFFIELNKMDDHCLIIKFNEL